jgi:coproporphyrinogen III oxidase-like Fe-S oxidoreductase
LAPLAPPRHLAPLATWAPHGRALAAYLHIPFCVARCGYCSFTTSPHRPEAMDRFLRALQAEIGLLAELPWAGAVELATVFLGGGTPSLLVRSPPSWTGCGGGSRWPRTRR